MAYSSIMGADPAPSRPSGRDSDALGPSDISDSGSDAIGTGEVYGDSDASGTGERGAVFGGEAEIGSDIAPNRVVRIKEGEGNGFPEADPDGQEFTDLDADAEGEAGDDEAER
ncbi:hypothetical protein WG922_19120 [Ramlibacter sp. AN1015]|uniref:hypothetical protein n=1 Tax=Ramlibacter sp. AN1015 TaxID=3133428 RepID=UPI0030C53830